MPAASVITRNSVATHVKALAQGRKPNVTVVFKGQDADAVPSFSTLDKIEGEVILTATHDCRFDGIEISFEGYVKTFVENLAVASAAHSRTSAYHRFLKLTQPIDDADLPQPRIAEAGRTYRFPFTFVVPAQLLPHACSHNRRNDQIHEAHMCLPPSLGDQTVAGGGSQLDDLAPAMSKINYGIKVHITRDFESTDKTVTLVEKTQKIRIVPAVDEAPPITVDSKTDDYVLRKEKGLRKGVFKGKLGRISVEAAQPKSLRLGPTNTHGSACPTTTAATVNVRFDPADANAMPPKLHQLTSKLNAVTFFASRPMADYPSRASALYDSSVSLYETSVSLSSRCVEKAEWTRHEPELLRRDSAYSSMSSASNSTQDGNAIAAPSKAYNGQAYYTARVVVPITLPKNKAFVPTFHSCLVARIYQLELNLSLSSSPSTAQTSSSASSSVKLLIPIQISSAGSLPNPLAASTGLSARVSQAISEEDQAALAAEAEAEGYFAPRTISVPDEGFIQRGSLADMQAIAAATAELNAREAAGQEAPADSQSRDGVNRAPPPGYSAFSDQGRNVGLPRSLIGAQARHTAMVLAPGCG